jgi:hypothetical protein
LVRVASSEAALEKTRGARHRDEASMKHLLLLVFVAACASSGTTAENTTPKQAAIFQSAETGTLLTERPRASVITVAAPPSNAWLAVKAVYAEMEIPLTVDNAGTRQLGNQNFFKTRVLAGQPMANFVDCGSGMTGPKASTYRIYISLLTQVTPNPDGTTTVQTTFVPMGQDVSAGSSDRIPCGSTGRFEQLFLDRIKATLGKP